MILNDVNDYNGDHCWICVRKLLDDSLGIRIKAAAFAEHIIRQCFATTNQVDRRPSYERAVGELFTWIAKNDRHSRNKLRRVLRQIEEFIAANSLTLTDRIKMRKKSMGILFGQVE